MCVYISHRFSHSNHLVRARRRTSPLSITSTALRQLISYAPSSSSSFSSLLLLLLLLLCWAYHRAWRPPSYISPTFRVSLIPRLFLFSWDCTHNNNIYRLAIYIHTQKYLIDCPSSVLCVLLVPPLTSRRVQVTAKFLEYFFWGGEQEWNQLAGQRQRHRNLTDAHPSGDKPLFFFLVCS